MDRESVGAKIKALRQSRGLKGKDLADKTGLSAAAISKFENGLLRPTDTLIDAVIKALDLSAQETYALRELSSFVNSQFARWSTDSKAIATNQHNHAIREKNSRVIRGYFNQIIPGLLQSERYMSVVFETLVRSDRENIAEFIRSRKKRQKILQSKKMNFTYVLSEGALRACLGSRDTLVDALRHLIHLIDTYPTVEIRVLPWNKVLNRVLVDSFVLFDERNVNIEVMQGELDLWTGDDVSYYVDTMNYLVSASLSQAASKEFIEAVIKDIGKQKDG